MSVQTISKQSHHSPINISKDAWWGDEGRFVSETEYWAEYYEGHDANYEWNNGYLEAKPMASTIEFAMYLWFIKLVDQYLTVQPIGTTTGLETGFNLTLPHKKTIRKPDFGVVLHRNPIALEEQDRRYHGIFDLCIEAVSASSRHEIERDTVDKYEEYRLAGVQEYYILDERGKETAFLHNVGGQFQPIQPLEGVIRSTILPGFQFRVDDLYQRPTLIDLATDEVYQGYILPEYQRERQQRQAAQAEAETERQAKEKLAAKLRELGIDPTTV